MVKTKAELESIAQHYMARLAEHHISVEKVIVIGSYGRGTPADDSDIDLIFVSRDFDGHNLLQRQRILASCRPGLARTDVLGYSPSMLEKRREHSPLVQQIFSEGVALFPAAA